MCMQVSAVRPYQKWRWAGDEIVHSPVIPAARRIAGSRKSGYPIDIREYLSIESNAVVHDWIHALLATLPVEDRLRFFSRSEGCFDFRAATIARGFAGLRRLPSKRHFDQWLFPDETLHQQGGDCEDLAFALAALLGASGISNECIRVALGTLTDRSVPGKERSWDHAWVVYQLENGAWQILEPVAKVAVDGAVPAGKRRARQPLDVEYVPHFVFNADHLWRVRSKDLRAADPFADYLASRDGNFWEGFNPSFAAGVHNDIFDQALAGMSTVDLSLVKAVSLGVDANVLQYDPRDHFDFAYIPEGWDRVAQRLAAGSLRDFALAAHAIGDFYAHSLYGYFAQGQATDGRLPVYDPAQPLPPATLKYDFLAAATRPGSDCSADDFQKNWNGKLISGQWWRWYSTYPKELEGDAELRLHRCLPDHDALAVDGPSASSTNVLFKAAQYQAQFALRRGAAIEHVKASYAAWKAAGH